MLIFIEANKMMPKAVNRIETNVSGDILFIVPCNHARREAG